MRNTDIKSIIVALFGSFLLTSCDKELSAPPQNAKVEINTVTDEASAQVVLNGAYLRLANVNLENNATVMNAHHLAGAITTGYLGYGFGSYPQESNNLTSGPLGGDVWGNAYQLINAANGLIYGVERLDPNAFSGTRRAELLGEAKFLRAYGHFQVLTHYAQWFDLNSAYGVLLRKELANLSNIKVPRSTVDASYTYILADLEDAIAGCKTENPKHYATKYAAMALKIRVLMCRGTQQDYQEVIALANSILEEGGYQLESNLKDLFHTKGLASTEVIWGTKPQANQELFYDNMSYSYYPGASGLWAATPQFIALFKDGDPRKEWMMGGLVIDEIDYANPDIRFMSKYITAGTSPTQVSETSYLFRLSEIYLMKSEAILRSNGRLQDARDILKLILSKSGVQDVAYIDALSNREDLLLENFYEVSRNLTAEDGIEWLAFLRLPMEKVKELRPTIESNIQFIYPIPVSELNTNPVFGLQNPGYSNQ